MFLQNEFLITIIVIVSILYVSHNLNFISLQDDKSFAKDIIVEMIQNIKIKPNKAKDIIKKSLKDRTTYGDSPLHCAFRYGQKDNVKRILMLMSTLNTDAEELVNIRNSSGKVSFFDVIFYLIMKIFLFNYENVSCYRVRYIMLLRKINRKLQKHYSCLTQIQI